MIVVRLAGGLGNQMFQYAAGLRLAIHHHTELKLDLTFLLDRTPREHFSFRDFDLTVFNLAESIASVEEVRRMRGGRRTRLGRLAKKLIGHRCYFERGPAFDSTVLNLPNETYLEGFFQDERYFLDIAPIIRQKFHLAPDETRFSTTTRELADAIRSNDGICTHVRRGDYVNNPVSSQVHGACSLDYYRHALRELRLRSAKGRAFIFSDDVAWCRQSFNSDEFIVAGDEYAGLGASTHFWLMTLCKHFVISNSTFSWWAAWLAQKPDSVICSPIPWFDDPRYGDMGICPSSWLRIPKR